MGSAATAAADDTELARKPAIRGLRRPDHRWRRPICSFPVSALQDCSDWLYDRRLIKPPGSGVSYVCQPANPGAASLLALPAASLDGPTTAAATCANTSTLAAAASATAPSTTTSARQSGGGRSRRQTSWLERVDRIHILPTANEEQGWRQVDFAVWRVAKAEAALRCRRKEVLAFVTEATD